MNKPLANKLFVIYLRCMKFEFDAHRLGYCLKAKRLVWKINQKAASEQIGISQGSISRAERRQQMEVETFVKISNWLGVAPGEFFKQI